MPYSSTNLNLMNCSYLNKKIVKKTTKNCFVARLISQGVRLTEIRELGKNRHFFSLSFHVESEMECDFLRLRPQKSSYS